MIAKNQKFMGLRISLDGGAFHECTFDGCHLVYSGFLPVTLDECTYRNCEWEFAGPALNTLNFMQGIYAVGATELMENTFQQIRGNTHFGPVLSSAP